MTFMSPDWNMALQDGISYVLGDYAENIGAWEKV